MEPHGDAGVLGFPSPVSSPSPMLCNKASELTSSLVLDVGEAFFCHLSLSGVITFAQVSSGKVNTT